MYEPKQITLSDIFTGCLDSLENDKPRFLSLVEEHIDLDALIPKSFYEHFYQRFGRPRKYPLRAFLWALIIQRIFSIPTDRLLIVFLTYSPELRKFCGFTKAPDASKFTRFKQCFTEDLQLMFDGLVDLTEPILQEIDGEMASMTIFDTSGVESYVRENNPKYADSIIKGLKAWKKVNDIDDSYDPYKAAYSRMPAHAAANPSIKQMYANGHFCYAYKFGIVTNGLGIVRDIAFYDEAFFAGHPEIEISKKSNSPDVDKSIGDARALLPTLRDFFGKHPQIKPGSFLGDTAFDTIDIYSGLLAENGLGFSKAFIPTNERRGLDYPDCPLNEDGVPCCPNDPSLPMRQEGNTSHLHCKKPTLKFVCPKMKWKQCDDGKYRRRTSCEDPCTTSPCGRMFYVYPEKNLRAFPGTVRGTDEWDNTYKTRCSVERTINHFKDSLGLAGRRTQNAATTKADLFLVGITQQLSVLLADAIHRYEFLRSIKPLIAA